MYGTISHIPKRSILMKKLILSVFAATLFLGFASTSYANKIAAKCLASAAVLAKAQAMVKAAAYGDCKAKHKLTHVVRCRALKKALQAAEADVAAARHNHRICHEGCGWLAKKAADAAAAFNACVAAHKWTHRVRCLNAKNASKAATARLIACKARK
jgi:hypothetical protein